MALLKEGKKILISGTSSGLGQFLYSVLPADKFERGVDLNIYRKTEYDIIIHCAIDARPRIFNSEVHDFWENNVTLTKNLLNIPHKYFIFMSSVAVYPKEARICHEDMVINYEDILGVYGMMKYYSECLVQKNATKNLILRLSGLLGQQMRINSLIRILLNQKDNLSLHAASEFNYIEYDDVKNLIIEAYNNNFEGILNCCSIDNISLQSISNLYLKKVVFGNYIYKTPVLSCERLLTLSTFPSKTSKEVVRNFWNKYNEFFV